MKIKNILLISLAVLAFASCSKDDDANVPQGPVDAVVSFATTASSVRTKVETGTGETKSDVEKRIASLNAYIFDKSGNLIGSSRVTAKNEAESLTSIGNIAIKISADDKGYSKDEYKALIIANVGEKNIPTINALETMNLGNAIGSYQVGASILPMVSEMLTIEAGKLKKAEKDASGKYSETDINWITDGGGVINAEPGASQYIKLTRLVARVDVEKVIVELDKNNYPGATFKLDTISLVNVRSEVNAYKEGMGAFVKGYQSFNYRYSETDKGWIIPDNIIKSLSQYYRYAFTGNNSPDGFQFNSPFDDNGKPYEQGVSNPFFFRYIFPNSKDSEYKTALLISGIFKYTEAQGAKEELRHYRVFLYDQHANDTGTGIDKAEVLANTVYKLTVTITGEGSKDENHPEENASIKVDVQVGDWTKLPIQKEDIGEI